jgi:hypothetical protein
MEYHKLLELELSLLIIKVHISIGLAIKNMVGGVQDITLLDNIVINNSSVDVLQTILSTKNKM